VNRSYWAYEFTEWLTSAEQDERWNVEYGNLPLRSSEIDSEAFTTQVEQFPGLEIMAANAENAKQARPTVAGYVGLSEVIANAISQVLQGQGDPQTALDEAAEAATAELGE
jgi:multiple sugar transport system substrate-binding protein